MLFKVQVTTKFTTNKKKKVQVTGKASDIDIRRGQESTRLTSLSEALYSSQLATENRLKKKKYTSRL